MCQTIGDSSCPFNWVTLPRFSSMCGPCSLIRQEALIGTKVYQLDLGHPVTSLSLYWNYGFLAFFFPGFV
jgi:hypothetical protein